MKSEEEWLLVLADPEGPRSPLPGHRLDAPGVASLCLLANRHGVLPAVRRELERLLRHEPAQLLADRKTVSDALQAVGEVKDRLAQRSAMAMFLGAEARRLAGELAGAGADAIVLKGVDFASRLYAQPALRLFGDIDLLVRASDWKRVGAAMARLEYRELPEKPMKHKDGYAERKWEHPAMPGAVVEVHDNLVNSPTVRRGVSVPLEDLPLERGPDGRLRAAPAGLLIIAAVHGARGQSWF
ncbi:MAG: nucleotidyltransferase family protein [Verrucomicrobiota bacterium]